MSVVTPNPLALIAELTHRCPSRRCHHVLHRAVTCTWTATLLALLGIFAQFPAYACSIVYPTVPVGTNFRVRATNNGLPIGSLPLVLADSLSSRRVFHSTTDAEGFALFSGVPAGSFLLTAERDGGMSGVVVKVSATGPTNVIVPLQWPDSVLYQCPLRQWRRPRPELLSKPDPSSALTFTRRRNFRARCRNNSRRRQGPIHF
jgi:hypothetical protein